MFVIGKKNLIIQVFQHRMLVLVLTVCLKVLDTLLVLKKVLGQSSVFSSVCGTAM